MFCNKCGQRIADDSRYCKFCGTSQEQDASVVATATESQAISPGPRTHTGKIIGIAIAGMLLLLLFVSLAQPPSSTALSQNDAAEPVTRSDNASDPSSNSGNTVESLSGAEPASDPWSYSSDVDKVRGGTTFYATTTSTNSIHQDFPYDSSTTMDMTLRKSPAYGTDVLLRISSGQMMCPSYEGCSGTVRFDNGVAEDVRFAGPSDSSSDVVFVEGANSFIAKLKRANKVVIEKTLYEAGSPQFEFDVHGLKWDH